MSKVILTFGYATILVFLGGAGFLLSEYAGLGELVPAVFGVLMFGLGMAMFVGMFRVHAFYLAALVALAMFLTGVPAIGRTLTWTFAPDNPSPVAQVVSAIGAVLSMVYVVVMLRGFLLPSEEHPEEG